MFNCFLAPIPDLNEGELGKTVITKKQIIETGHQDKKSARIHSGHRCIRRWAKRSENFCFYEGN